jgi:hypothetical protein
VQDARKGCTPEQNVRRVADAEPRFEPSGLQFLRANSCSVALCCRGTKGARFAGMETSSTDGLAAATHEAIPVAPFAMRGGPARALGAAIARRLYPQAPRKPPDTIVVCGRCVVVKPVGFLCERDGHLVFTSNS